MHIGIQQILQYYNPYKHAGDHTSRAYLQGIADAKNQKTTNINYLQPYSDKYAYLTGMHSYQILYNRHTTKTQADQTILLTTPQLRKYQHKTFAPQTTIVNAWLLALTNETMKSHEKYHMQLDFIYNLAIFYNQEKPTQLCETPRYAHDQIPPNNTNKTPLEELELIFTEYKPRLGT